MTAAPPNSRGFTLVELVIVLVVLGVLVGVGAPKFFDVGIFRSRGFFDEIVAAARYGQKFAVATGCQVQLEITADSYALTQRSACDTVTAFDLDVPHPSRPGPFVPDEPSPDTISPAPTTIVFDGMGCASSTATIAVGSRSFRIHGESGFVEIL